MQRFRPTASNAAQVPSNEEIVEALLVEAGASDCLPTDESRLLGYLKLEQLSFDFMHELDFLPKQQEGSKEIRAALSLNDRLVATQSGLGDKRKRFGIFHEIAHFILPEHRDKLFLDSDATLSFWTKVRIEREANEIAAELVFQGNRFTDEALSAPTSFRTVLEVAPRYGASYESAIRRYTERHALPCAVIVYDKADRHVEDPEFDDTEYKVHYMITSRLFRQHYFSGIEVGGGTLKGSELGQTGGWLKSSGIVEQEMSVERGKGGEPWRFETEIFTNGYKVFQFLLPPKDAVRKWVGTSG